MASLASKDVYFQKFARTVCSSRSRGQRKRHSVPFRDGNEMGPAKKKRKKKHKQAGKEICSVDIVPNVQSRQKNVIQSVMSGVPNLEQKDSKLNSSDKPVAINLQFPKDGMQDSTDISAVDFLRQKLHEKIEKCRGNSDGKTSSSEQSEKRRERRKQERERKKRKRKEFRMKKLAAEAGENVNMDDEKQPESSTVTKSGPPGKEMSTVVFNKVDVGKEHMSKVEIKQEKRKSVKGNLTPLTGKNYKQLLSRVEARKAKLEELRSKDEAKAKKVEEKMKWTNVLYKAEGLKIKDNEEMLRASLKRKEKMQAQRKRRWEQRSMHVLEKMQQRQDKRRSNIQKRKVSKAEQRKDKARKKGRVLPEDLEN